MSITNRHFVYINSLNRLSGTTSDFHFNLNLPSEKKFNRVVVLDAQIPKSYTLVDTTDTIFQLKEDSTTVDVTIPVGNYNFLSWQYILTQLLTTASPNGWTYTVTYPNINISADTGKLIYTVTGNSSQPSIIFLWGSSLNEQFGFDSGTTNVFSADTLTSKNVIKLQVEDNLNICSDLIKGSANNNLGILQHINVVGNANFSTVTYQCTSPYHLSKEIVNLSSSTAHFCITDYHNSFIDLNGLPFTATLLFYWEDDITKLMRSFLKYIDAKDTVI